MKVRYSFQSNQTLSPTRRAYFSVLKQRSPASLQKQNRRKKNRNREKRLDRLPFAPKLASENLFLFFRKTLAEFPGYLHESLSLSRSGTHTHFLVKSLPRTRTRNRSVRMTSPNRPPGPFPHALSSPFPTKEEKGIRVIILLSPEPSCE